jgi:hypothetical protein
VPLEATGAVLGEEDMLENIEMMIAPKNATPTSVPQPIGFFPTLAPHLGHVSASELISAPHSLHLINAISPSRF